MKNVSITNDFIKIVKQTNYSTLNLSSNAKIKTSIMQYCIFIICFLF